MRVIQEKAKVTIPVLLVLLSSVFVALSPAAAAFAQTAISCGDTITKSTTLTSDIGPCSSGNGLIIGADNIILNCNGHTITGAGESNSDNSNGIQIIGHSGVTIKNCIVTEFRGILNNGFYLEKSSNNKLLGNKAIDNSFGFVINGDFAANSGKNILDRNTATVNAGNGFSVGYGSDYNLLTRNTANGNGYGFFVYVASYNMLTGNTAANNRETGFFVGTASNNKLTGNTATGNGYGFYINGGNSIALTGNTATNNKKDGFHIFGSTSNTLTANRADTNSGYGYSDVITQGTGTAGIENTYRVNECLGNTAGGSSPTGLCRPQA